MANDWIKMRGSVVQEPRFIRLCALLKSEMRVTKWRDEDVTRTLRGVTLLALLKFWSASRELGKFDEDDLVLRPCTLDDLDQMADLPCFGRCLAAVGWAIEDTENQSVRLPKFKRHNVPATGAQRMQELRAREKQAKSRDENVTKCDAQSVTRASHSRYHIREEKRREDDEEASILSNGCCQHSEDGMVDGESETKKPCLDWNHVKDSWNALATEHNLAHVRKIPDKVRRKLTVAFRERPDFWQALAAVLRNRTSAEFKASGYLTLEFVSRAGKLDEFEGGKYQSAFRDGTPRAKPSTGVATDDELAQVLAEGRRLKAAGYTDAQIAREAEEAF